ncbi:TonB-dependent siderophore receptor [Chitinilyticum piscinae]|uniref:TonB-dependent siderophore receptor n=1 Tax=Chitinilyticum piscinae TaxID=2866724 RepID=A0A8J7G3E4_9NEIS|nr:TonB-dependent siderophore receptor [Chitinilyticum piscinae]MBE9610643.1 TonB-dependent siderophore receptor [Chitinilyticum piscinae]
MINAIQPAGFARKPVSLLIATLLGGAQASAFAADGAVTLPEVQVSASLVALDTLPTEQSTLYTIKRSSSATELDMSLKETPQTVSIVSNPVMQDFAAKTVNDALTLSSGVVVEKVETDRTYYTARGFDVTNFQVDGLGVPFANNEVVGALDTAIYDRIEVVYGANGLMTGTGMPSAAINFIRKRPLDTFHASADVQVGSWNALRVDGDISAPLNEAGSVKGRLVVAGSTADSYIDRYSNERALAYGISEAELGEHTRAALGFHYQKNNSSGNMWGAVPMLDSKGQQIDYPTSISSAADWSYWNTEIQSAFAEMEHHFSADWKARLAFTRNEYRNNGELFYVYGTPDAVTGEGVFSYPSQYSEKNIQNIADLALSGKFALGGRNHELAFGGNWSTSRLDALSRYGNDIGTALPPLWSWDGRYPKPEFNASSNGANFKDERQSLYLATRLHLLDPLHLIAGARWTSVDITGQSYGQSRASSASDTTPYVGATFDLNDNLALYASYSKTFNPQHQLDVNGDVLAPVRGASSEAGIKGEFFNKTLNASLAVFRTSQNNLAEQAGYKGADAYYRGIDAESTGVQLDVSGQLAPGWQASAGYTGLSLDNPQGDAVRTYVPRHLLRLATTYQLPFVTGLKVGGSVNWQDGTSATADAGTLRQEAYAILNLMARYEFSQQFSAAINLNNVTNEKYLSSLYWGNTGQGYYGAPFNASVTLSWKY